MAKGKHAAALFEVINKGRSPGSPIRRKLPRMGLPKWWSDRAPRAEAPADGGVPLMPSAPPRVGASESRRDSSPASGWNIDRAGRFISIRLSYRAGTLCGLGALVLLALTFTVGRQMARTPSPLLSLSTEELQAGQAHPAVLDVSRQTDAATDAPRAATAAVAAAPATHSVIDTKRSFGLNYVVVQSYLKQEDAQQARDLLIKHDIFCTVEKNLPHYGSNGWYSVVGLAGFDRIRGVKEYQNYIAAILKVSRDYDAQHRGFKNFDPQPYKWR